MGDPLQELRGLTPMLDEALAKSERLLEDARAGATARELDRVDSRSKRWPNEVERLRARVDELEKERKRWHATGRNHGCSECAAEVGMSEHGPQTALCDHHASQLRGELTKARASADTATEIANRNSPAASKAEQERDEARARVAELEAELQRARDDFGACSDSLEGSDADAFRLEDELAEARCAPEKIAAWLDGKIAAMTADYEAEEGPGRKVTLFAILETTRAIRRDVLRGEWRTR